MKNLTILLLLFIVFAFADWDVDPDYSTLTADSADIDMLTGDTVITDNFLFIGDTTVLDSGGIVIRQANNRVEFWNDTLWFKGFHPVLGYMLSIDTGKVYLAENDALVLSHSDYIKIAIPHTATEAYTFSSINWRGYPDTTKSAGMAVYRWEEVWTLRNYLTSPDKADTNLQYMSDDTMYYESENPNKFDNDIFVEGDLTVNGKLTSTSVTRGQATFTRNTEVDTVAGITGVSTNSIVLLTPKMATALTGQLTWTYLNTDSILVHVLPADTTGQAVVYCWFRIE